VTWLGHFRTGTNKVAEFTEGRRPQADGEFLAACDLPADSRATRYALAVRKVFAEEGSVDPQFILAADRFPEELGVLPFWDSIDMLDLVFRLEKELRVKIPGNPFPRKFSVRQFIHCLISSVPPDSPPIR